MGDRGAPTRVGRFLRGLLLLLASITDAAAAVQDSRFSFSADRSQVDFDVRDVARREVLDRLLDGKGIKLQWLSRE